MASRGTKRPRPAYLEPLAHALSLPLTASPTASPDQESMETLYHGAVALGEATGQQAALPALHAAHVARLSRSTAAVDAAGIATDAAAVSVLVQSIGSSRAPLAVCQPGTLLSWTRYYKHVTGEGQKATGEDEDEDEDEDADGLPLKRRRILSSAPSPSGQSPAAVSFDLLSSLASCPDLVLQVCTYLRPADVFVLYRVSRVFKATIDAGLPAQAAWFGRLYVPDALAVFPWTLYEKRVTCGTMFEEDDQTRDDQTRDREDDQNDQNDQNGQAGQANLRYLSLLVSRDRKVRDILACLARAGHRLPHPAAALTLKKIWLLMDVATNRGRHAVLQSVFSDLDLLITQMFCAKLTMHLGDPLFGVPSWAANHARQETENDGENGDNDNQNDENANTYAHTFAHVLLGQRGGLDLLWKLLRGRACTTAHEAIELKVRYDYLPPVLPRMGDEEAEAVPDTPAIPGTPADIEQDYAAAMHGPPPHLAHQDQSPVATLLAVVHTVPLWEMGVGHLEGWGRGSAHLLRPDELLPLEAARRGLDLSHHVPFLAVWGYRDFATGANLVPTLDEIYMSDEEAAVDVSDLAASAASASVADIHPILDAAPLSPSLSLSHPHHRRCLAAQQRLESLCGNVPCAPGEWQPWQLLKAQWADLPLHRKIDVWWVCHQERLKSQAWMHDDGQEPAGRADGGDGEDEELLEVQSVESVGPVEEAVEAGHDDMDESEDLGAAYGDDSDVDAQTLAEFLGQGSESEEEEDNDNDGNDGNDGNSDLFVLDYTSRANDTNFFRFPRLLHHHRPHDAGGSSSSSSSSKPCPVGGTQGPSPTPAPAPTDAPLRVASAGTTVTSSRSFSLRHRRLMAACVQSALQQQVAVDVELMEQADAAYEPDDLAWWEAALAEEIGLLQGPTEVDGAEEEVAEEEGEEGEEAGMEQENVDPVTPANPQTPQTPETPEIPEPTPDDVLARYYGGDDDVLALLDQVTEAENVMDRWQSAGRPLTPAQMGAVQFLRHRLEARLEAEVFALDFGEA